MAVTSEASAGSVLLPPESMDVVVAAPRWAHLIKRSATLDGSLPLRAARFCRPVMEGTEAGGQIVFSTGFTVSRRRGLSVNVADPTGESWQAGVDAMAAVVERGLLPRGGHWHRLFKEGPVVVQRTSLLVWTGMLIRPRPGVSLLVSRAFNRHARLVIKEYSITDDSEFSPLVIELDALQFGPAPAVVLGEVGCVTPLWTGFQLELRKLSEVPHIVDGYIAVHNPAYGQQRRLNQNSGNYVRHPTVRGAPAARLTGTVGSAWPEKHLKLKTFDRVLTKTGFRRKSTNVQFLEASAVLEFEAAWDGRFATQAQVSGPNTPRDQLHQWWKEKFGEGAHAFTPREPLYSFSRFGDALLNCRYPAFCETPAGWVSIVDGFDFEGAWGMRGVIETSWYGGIVGAWHFYEATRFHIRRKVPLMRSITVPQELLKAPIRMIDLAEAADESASNSGDKSLG